MKFKVEVVELNTSNEKELIYLSERLNIKDINTTQRIIMDMFYAYVSDTDLEMFKKFLKGKYKK